jgi:hypothetical protein
MVEVLAGKQTSADISIGLTAAISVSLALSVGWVIEAKRSRGRKAEVERLRQQSKILEMELRMLREGKGKP